MIIIFYCALSIKSLLQPYVGPTVCNCKCHVVQLFPFL